MMDMDEAASAVDVADLKASAFLEAQAAGVDGGETNSVARQSDAIENLTHLRQADLVLSAVVWGEL